MAKKVFIKDNSGNQILPITSSDNVIYVKNGNNVSLTSYLDNLVLQGGTVTVNYREDIGNDRSSGNIGSFYINAPKDMIDYSSGNVTLNLYRFAGYDDHRGDDEYGLFPAPKNDYSFLKSDGTWGLPKLDIMSLFTAEDGSSTGFSREQLMFNHLYLSAINAKCRYVTTASSSNDAYIITEQLIEGTNDGVEGIANYMFVIKLNCQNSNNVVKVSTHRYLTWYEQVN